MKMVKLYPYNGSIRAHIKHGGKFYVISDDGYGTMIFKADKNGLIVDWFEVGGWNGLMIGEILASPQAFEDFWTKSVQDKKDK